ncbi:hypothetical protein F5X99DRAFT_93837 [Biscogniauxia marginata]|nr:hypothetical protein F5X99DRAFT_93837 [Biscogniauxia marginata]
MTTASQASTLSCCSPTDNDHSNENNSIHDNINDNSSTNYSNIDITNAPVTIRWAQGEQSATLDFDLHFHGPDHEAFFKLHGAVGLKASTNPPRRSHTTRIYLFISPEKIQSLTLDTSWPDNTSSTNHTTTRLGFTLVKPPGLVMPVPDFKLLTPKNKTFGAILDASASLACQLSFNISLPRTCLSNERLRLLIQAFSDRDRHPLKTIARLAETKSLYAGRGGYIIQLPGCLLGNRDDQAGEDADAPTGKPPSYEDVVSSPSPTPPPRKRARRSSSTPDVEKPRLLGFEARLISLVEDRLASMECRIQQSLAGLDRRVSSLEKAVEEAQENVDFVRNRLDEVVEERDDAIDEAKFDLRVELQDFVEDEMEVERARLRARFATLRQNLSNSLQDENDD